MKRFPLKVEDLEVRSLLSVGPGHGPAPGIRAAEAPSLSAPLTNTVALAPGSDPDGNGIVLASRVVLVGQTAPGVTVRLDETSGGKLQRVTTSDTAGAYRFTVNIAEGRTTFHLVATDAIGRTAATDLMVERGDVLIDWNKTALDAVRAAGTNPPMVARNLAMVQLSVYDAVNSIDPRYQPYDGLTIPKARGASEASAVAGAADAVLRALYPAQAARFDATLAESLATVPRGPARALGLSVGREAGAAILALRADDGSSLTVLAPPATMPGQWSPTPPKFAAPIGLNFAYVTPFAMTSPSEFRPGPPPALDSAAYAAALNEVKSVGAVNSTTRTPDQTAYALFWSDLSGTTFTPPGHWNQIAEDAALTRRLDLASEAHLFALLDISLADAGIAAWEAKNDYDFWRPVTAIRQAATDGNPQTAADPTWTPLWATPPFSSYISGHATFSAAAATVLDSAFGPNFAFTDYGDPTLKLPPRQFTGFDQAATEAANSRMYGGIHFRFDNEAGLAVGKQVGQYVLQHELPGTAPAKGTHPA